MNKIKIFSLSILFAGIIVFFIGLYFSIIGAGIPYQDPTTELTLQWMANNLAGALCIRCGSIVAIIGVFGYTAYQFISHKK